MRPLRRFWKRLVGSFSGGRHEPALAEEIEAHLQLLTDHHIAMGLSSDDARRAARLEFGHIEPAKELYRDQLGFPLLRNLGRDLRFACRMLRREPAVSIPAILVLALGIGAATALYAVVYAMWLRPLSYPDSQQLVSVTTYFAAYKIDALGSGDYGTWQGTRALGPLAAYNIDVAGLSAPGETIEVHRGQISGNLLDVLRVSPSLGRPIQPADDHPQSPRVVMLSDRIWREQFGADPSVIGRSTRMDGEAYTITGVLPPAFRMPGGQRVVLLTPLALRESWLRHGGAMKILYGVARLEPGVSIEQARAELSDRLAISRAQDPQIYRDDVSLRIIPLHDYAVRDSRSVALLLASAVILILLVAGANVAGLLVARAAGRVHEMSIRRALGASAARIAGHLLTEGLTIGVLGIAAGLAVAFTLVALLPRIPSVGVDVITLNPSIVTAAIAASLLCSLGFSLMPVLPLPRLRVRRALVAGELALSLTLAIAATLLIQNLAKLNSIAPGFRVDQLVTASINLSGTRFANTPNELRRELRRRLEATPGFTSISFADSLPPSGAGRITAFSRAGRPLPDAYRRDRVVVRSVDSDFFRSMGIPLLSGRTFTERDQSGAGLFAVVNRTLADRYFAGENPIGHQVDGDGNPWKTIVGVVADTRNDGLRNPARPEIYLPLTAEPARGGGITRRSGVVVVMPTAGDPDAAATMFREHLRAIDAGLLAHVQTMDEEWRGLQSGPRFQVIVFSGFAGLALLMACTGVYGVLSHMVVLRRREIGVRMALGARPVDVQRLILREAFLLALAGAAIGLAGAVAGSRLIESLLYEVNARDPLTLASSSAVLVALAICASLLPAWRASREDPAQTLRAE